MMSKNKCVATGCRFEDIFSLPLFLSLTEYLGWGGARRLFCNIIKTSRKMYKMRFRVAELFRTIVKQNRCVGVSTCRWVHSLCYLSQNMRMLRVNNLIIPDILRDVPGGLASMVPTLSILFLDRNGITDAILEGIAFPKQLKVLSLRDNRLRNLPSGCFPSSLTWLDLSKNYLKKLADFPPRLIMLDLSNNKLEPASFEGVRLEKTLKIMDVSDNNLGINHVSLLSKRVTVRTVNPDSSYSSSKYIVFVKKKKRTLHKPYSKKQREINK